MKKLKAVVLGLMTLVLCSCNQGIGWGQLKFEKVHISIGDTSKCVEITSWYDSEGAGIEVKTKDYGSLFLSEGTYILVSDKCPICDGK